MLIDTIFLCLLTSFFLMTSASIEKKYSKLSLISKDNKKKVHLIFEVDYLLICLVARTGFEPVNAALKGRQVKSK